MNTFHVKKLGKGFRRQADVSVRLARTPDERAAALYWREQITRLTERDPAIVAEELRETREHLRAAEPAGTFKPGGEAQ
ncbi:hypothetical protein [Ruficoccus sp. ZRK36]|uniref:hypothetical protein n=1 Tax=Ruficoccus sp. ZRK36 TaxID=2866311 RepID=UPI001C72F3B5|nr:hypothetical protein [Ruficoccus sp. ZRK36]QYY35294.1 hypothetical protein K0V07_13455 [Ruficoccus sp. ZRK36]